MSQPTAVVFDIMRFSIRDGPGIRTTVFLKGCPMDCWWCHNPESRSSLREPVFWSGRCIRCGACRDACPTGAVSGEGTCTLCGTCVEACPTRAREIIGRDMTAEELMVEIRKDRVFYEESGGGVTFSGGEPLMAHEFLEAVLDQCIREGVHTAVDTCGYVPPMVLRRLSKKVGLFLYDLKLMDDEKHRTFTGVSNEQILKNLEELASMHASVMVRIPIIPGVNDDDGNIERTGEFLSRLGLTQVRLLPYHTTAMDKYRRLRRPYRLENLEPPPVDRLAALSQKLESYGMKVGIGG